MEYFEFIELFKKVITDSFDEQKKIKNYSAYQVVNEIRENIETILSEHDRYATDVDSMLSGLIKTAKIRRHGYVCQDIIKKFTDLVPPDAGYRHMEGNSDSHIKTSMIGSSVTVIVEDGRLLLGTWQKIFFCEFDGPRSRKVYITV